MKRLTILLILFALISATGYTQNGIYLYGNLNYSQGEPVEMTANIYSDSPVVVDFSTNSEGVIETFWVPLPSEFWSHLTVDFTNCQGLDVTAYVYNDSLNTLIDVYVDLDYCNNDYIWGCTDVNAMNYNPTATYDDGTCMYSSVPNDHCEDAIPLSWGTTIIDNTGATNTGDIFGACWGFGSGEAEQNSLWYSFTTPDVPASIHLGTYTDGTNSLSDTQFGIFESCGGEMIYCDGNSGPNLHAALDFACGELAENTTYILIIDGWYGNSGTCLLTFEVDTACTLIPGCTDPTALNFNPDATADDGSCVYNTACTEGEMIFDYYAWADSAWIFWELAEVNGAYADSGYFDGFTYLYDVCLPDGCYDLTLTNLGENSGGMLTLVFNNLPFFSEDHPGADGSHTYTFGVNSEGCDGTLEVLGCTDPLALNYDPLATVDDGSCEYFNTDCEITFQVVPDSSGENVIWIYTSFDPNSTISVLWDFGDGNTSNEWYPSHTYADEGPYNLCVSVIIGDPANAECAASFCIEVDGSMIGSGLVSSGFTINVVDSSTILSDAYFDRSFDLNLWPNPAQEKLQLRFTAETGAPVTMRVYDLTGKMIYATNRPVAPGENTFELVLNAFESGIYTLELISDEARWIQKFVVGR